MTINSFQVTVVGDAADRERHGLADAGRFRIDLDRPAGERAVIQALVAGEVAALPVRAAMLTGIAAVLRIAE